MSKGERATFRACFGGWALDGMDFQFYSFVIPTLIAAWGTSPRARPGRCSTTTLLASAARRLAGRADLSDRIGRVRTLQITILWFAFFTVLCGFAQNFSQLLVLPCPDGPGLRRRVGRRRGADGRGDPRRSTAARRSGAVQSGWALGWGAAALLYTVAFSLLPRADRLARAVPRRDPSLAPRDLHPPQRRRARRLPRRPGERHHRALLGDLRSRRSRPPPRSPPSSTTGAQGGYYAITTWLPTYLKSVRGLSVFNTGAYLGVVIAGSFSGYLVSAYLSDHLGRKKNFYLFSLCSMVTVLTYTLAPISDRAMLVLGFPLGFFASGIFSGMGAFFTELFPTRIRGSGQGFSYNFGRGVGALFPSVIGFLSASIPLGRAIGIFAASAYAVLFVAAVLLPETRGRELAAVA